MRLNDLLESRREFPRTKLLAAIFQHNRQHVDYRDEQTKTEFLDEYRELMANLRFPLTIYRGFAFEELNTFFDARDGDFDGLDDDEKELVRASCSRLDFRRIGTSWTWDRDAAVEGGALERSNSVCHCLVVAQVESRHIDWTVTLWQNLTVYEEEKEVRLLPNIPIKIIGANPNLWRLPMRANTGPESWDRRSDTINHINRYLGNVR